MHINSEESATHLVINKILLNKNLSVTKSKLVELLKVLKRCRNESSCSGA